MARIRTIKPEFPQSETVGSLSRDARLLFILLWTIADDSGRLRGNVAYLSGALFPYDDDARGLLAGWIAELEREGCVRRYEVDGKQYLDIPKWLKHQKIEKPSASRIPEFTEASPKPPRKIAEASAPDLGPRTLDQDLGPRTMDHDAAPKAAPPSTRGTRFPHEAIPETWKQFCLTERPDLDPSATFAICRDYWIAQPGQRGVKRDWDATWRNWVRNQRGRYDPAPDKTAFIRRLEAELESDRNNPRPATALPEKPH